MSQGLKKVIKGYKTFIGFTSAFMSMYVLLQTLANVVVQRIFNGQQTFFCDCSQRVTVGSEKRMSSAWEHYRVKSYIHTLFILINLRPIKNTLVYKGCGCSVRKQAYKQRDRAFILELC